MALFFAQRVLGQACCQSLLRRTEDHANISAKNDPIVLSALAREEAMQTIMCLVISDRSERHC